MKAGRLSDDEVVRIRTWFARGYRSANQLASDHGMTAAAIHAVVQGSTYKHVGGPITWPGQRLSRHWSVRGRCRVEGCTSEIALSGWAQRMHLCARCFKLDGGKKCGRYKQGTETTITCRACRKKFTVYLSPSAVRPKTCSQSCGAKLSARKRAKRPSELTDELLNELYWGRNMTAPEIAAKYGDVFDKTTVQLWLIAAGIPRRASNWRTHSHCIVEGCDQPRHPLNNGRVTYGRLCLSHLRERERRRRQHADEQRVVAAGSELMAQISRLTTGLPSAVKNDVEGEIMLAALSGEIALPPTKESVQPLIARVFRENADAWKFLSLAAPVADGEGVKTWGERLGLQ